MLLLRLVVFGLLVAGVVIIVRMLMKPSTTVRCSRCDGKGYWLGARGREKCDWCNGTGRLPNLDNR